MAPSQCDQIWQNFATWAKIKKEFGHILSNYFVIVKIVNLLWQISHTFGQLFIVLPKGPNIEKSYIYLVTLLRVNVTGNE